MPCVPCVPCLHLLADSEREPEDDIVNIMEYSNTVEGTGLSFLRECVGVAKERGGGGWKRKFQKRFFP